MAKYPDASKTWDSFKVFFRAAHQDSRQSQAQPTASSAGYQANYVGFPSINQPEPSDAEFDRAISEESHALEAIANLATASATDKATIPTLTNTNAVLVKEIASLRKEITSLRFRPQPFGSNTHYCWSCGKKSDHPSSKCETRKPNHQTGATAANMMGGETRMWRRSS